MRAFKVLVAILLAILLVLLAVILVSHTLSSLANKDTNSLGDTEPFGETSSEILDYPNTIGMMKYSLTAPLLPEIVFSTTAEENGLGGTVYQIYGTVVEYISDEDGNHSALRVDTLDGEIVINDPFFGLIETFSTGEVGSIDQGKLRSFFPMPEVGELACIFAEYQDMSNKYDAPFFVYGSSDYITDALIECMELSEVPADTGASTTVPNETQETAPSTTAATVPTEATTAPTTSGMTTGKANALKKAKSYLNSMAFSRLGLIKQLEYEGYTTAEATYAADNCGADWNTQAAKKAKSYLNTMAFSYSGLVSQLEYEGFTNSQAVHGVDSCGADWNAQAAKKAQSYISLMVFTRDGLISQLQYEGFTYSQAAYGADSVGLT